VLRSLPGPGDPPTVRRLGRPWLLPSSPITTAPKPRPQLPAPGAGRVRLVATDLDGTFLGLGGEVSARAAGIHVVPVTGRPPQALWHLARAGGLGPFGVCSNGAAVVDLEEPAVVETNPIDGDVAGLIVDLARRAAPGLILAIDDLDHFRYEPDFLPDGSDWDEQLTEVGDIRVHAVDGCVKLIARCPGTGALELMDRLTTELGSHGQVTTSGLDWVEIGAAGVSKAAALSRVCDRLGISRDEVVAIGDNYNDLSVLGWAGQAMAPANAVDAVLDIVGRVLPANTEDGVAVLLEELVAQRG
jgi:Cof subfamily protein (haloacid dehalogenase superfamily)